MNPPLIREQIAGKDGRVHTWLLNEGKSAEVTFDHSQFLAVANKVTVIVIRQKGQYSFPVMEFTPLGDFREIDAPALKVSIQEQLGLKFESAYALLSYKVAEPGVRVPGNLLRYCMGLSSLAQLAKAAEEILAAESKSKGE